MICNRLNLMVAMILLMGCGESTINSQEPKMVPDGMKFFANSQRIGARFAKPLKSRTDGFQIARLVQLNSGELAVPLFAVLRPKRDGGGADTWEDAIWYLGEGQEYFHLPVAPDIAKYVILIRPLADRAAGWHVWELLPTEIPWAEKDLIISVPQISDLEKLEARDDAAIILKKVDSAREGLGKLGSLVND